MVVRFTMKRLLNHWNEETLIRCIYNTAQKMKFSIKDFFSECDQIRRNMRI